MIRQNLDIVGGAISTTVLWTILISAICTNSSQNISSEICEVQTEQVTENQTYNVLVPSEISTKKSKVISHVHLTCYHPVKEQCNEEPLITANGSKIDLKKLKQGEIKWCAISRDLEWLFPLGSTIRITDEATGYCYGEYEIRDRMNKRWNHRIDILKHPEDKNIFSKHHIKIELV